MTGDIAGYLQILAGYNSPKKATAASSPPSVETKSPILPVTWQQEVDVDDDDDDEDDDDDDDEDQSMDNESSEGEDRVSQNCYSSEVKLHQFSCLMWL